MKLKIVKKDDLYTVKYRFFGMWFDCSTNGLVPVFHRYQAAETFGISFALERNEKPVFLS